MPGMARRCTTMCPVMRRGLRWQPARYDQSIPTPSLFNAVLNEARDIPTTGAVRLHRHGLDALVQNRSNRLTRAIVGVAVMPRSIRLVLAQSTSHCLADAAT